MNKFSSKALSVALVATTAVALSGSAFLLVAQAQTAPSFTRDLTVGSKGADVKTLQQWLNANGYQVAASGAGSTGNETTFFGPATKAALAKYQAAKGVTPSVGYFGPKTRASVLGTSSSTTTTTFSAGCTSATGYSPTTGLLCSSTTTAPASGLAVGLSATQPTGAIIAGGGQLSSGRWDFAGSGTITGLTFQKTGVVSDANMSNAYIADHGTGKVLGQYSSLTSGVLTFSGLNIPISGKTTLALRVDLSTSANAGNTISWSLTGATVSGGGSVAGLPVQGPSLSVTTVTNPALATAAFTFNSIGATTNAGTTGVLVADITANVSNSAVYLNNVKFTETGSANTADLQNLVLKVAGLAVGSTVSSVASDGSVYFDLTSTNVKLGTGNTSLQLYADVLGSPNRTMQYTILRTYDVKVTDSQYTAGISPTVATTNATTITINKGQITVAVSSTTPTGNVAVGVSGVTLGKFNVYASGEPVKIQFLDAKVAPNGAAWLTTAAAASDLTNVRINDDSGAQLGNTISTLAEGATSGACTYTASDSSTVCHFGTSGSPINYVVPANTTRVLSVVVDLKTTVVATTLTASLTGNTANLLGQVSNQTANSGAATGATRTVVSTSLASSVNSALGTPTYAKGKVTARVGSFTLSASSAQGVNVSSLTITTLILQSASNIIAIQNLMPKIGSTQFGTTQATVASSTAFSFSGSPISVPIGGSVIVDVYADILNSSNAATYAGGLVSLTGWTATGQLSGSAITFDSVRTGQAIIVSSGPGLTISSDASTVPAGQMVMGSTGNSLFTLRLAANNVEDIKVTDITYTDVLTATTTLVNSFQNLSLWDGASQVGGPLNLTFGTSNSQTVKFSFGTPVTVTQNGSKTLVLKGDIATFGSGGADSGSGHTFQVKLDTDVIALGVSSNAAATVTRSPAASIAGNTQSVYRSKITLSSATVGSQTGRPRTTVDDMARLTIAADGAGDVKIDSITLTFAGSLFQQAGTSQSATVSFLDDSTLTAPAGCNASCQGAVNINSAVTAPGTVVLSFGTAGAAGPYILTAGTSKTFRVRMNSSAAADTANVTENASITVSAAGDLTWEDQTKTLISIPANVVPFIVASGLGY